MSWDLKPEHCRAARYLLNWKIADLARKTGLTNQTIARFESGDGTPRPRTLRDIRKAFEDAGVRVLSAKAAGPNRVRCGDGIILAVEEL